MYNLFFIRRSPVYQDSSPTGYNASRGSEVVGNQGSFQNYGDEDPGDWVWSNASNSNGKSTEVKETTKAAATSTVASKATKKSKNGDDLLIDFGENKQKKAGTAPKTRSAEEEAWDMLNS